MQQDATLIDMHVCQPMQRQPHVAKRQEHLHAVSDAKACRSRCVYVQTTRATGQEGLRVRSSRVRALHASQAAPVVVDLAVSCIQCTFPTSFSPKLALLSCCWISLQTAMQCKPPPPGMTPPPYLCRPLVADALTLSVLRRQREATAQATAVRMLQYSPCA